MLSPKVFSVFAVLAIVTVSAVNNRNPQTNCNQPSFNANTHGLGTALGLDPSTLWSNPETLQKNLNQLLTKGGLNELTSGCNAFNNFYAGLGRDNIRFCLGPLGFIKRGKSPSDAWGFDGVLRQNRFQCGSGYYITQYHQGQMLSCIQNTVKNNIDKLNNVTHSYRSNVEHDQLQACKYVGILQKTYTQIFAKGACARVDAQLAGFWACEGQSQYISAQFPHCVYTNRCDFSTVTQFSEEYVRVNESGDMLIYIPPTWKKNAQGELFQEPEMWI
ncbi:hypothetical protein QR680_003073 [Steinernema hermaphroditum]|uniref:Uncharacterized protein n=1 Tax=Steinernema hermaphroditum TaxID=289476 RepID=A0AA39H595_9BILA|nr:hypothetical protein QR680_003073 [Steinernema hermaphroditum]